MAYIKSGDKCSSCKHIKIWSSNRNKASCKLHKADQGFNPDRSVPSKCVGKVTRK